MPRIVSGLVFSSLVVLALAPAAAHAAQTPPNYRVLSRIPVGGAGGWDYLSFDAPRQHLFVSRGDRVLVIDVAQGRQVASIGGTQGVHGIAIAPDLQRGYTSNGKSGSVTVFDLASLNTVATIVGTGQNPDAIVYDSASHHVLTFNGRSHDASVIEPAKNAVVATIALPGKPEFAVSDGAGHVYANIEDKSELVQMDTSSDKVLHTWSLAPCKSPSGLAIDRRQQRLFAVCDNQMMAVVDAGSGRLVTTVPIGDGPDAVVFDAATAMIYSSNGESGTLTAIHEDDPDHYRVTATIPTQPSARTLALDPDSHRLYLSAAQWDATRQANGRRAIVADSFGILVVGQP
jgi:DNA-binding beta-propeller fold protein YncE